MTMRAQVTADIEISGTLVIDAQLRNRVLDDGHSVPVICLVMYSTGPSHMPVHVEWPQPADGHHAAEQLVKTLKKGTPVTVQTPLTGMRLVAANAHQVHASAPNHPQQP